MQARKKNLDVNYDLQSGPIEMMIQLVLRKTFNFPNLIGL